MKSHRAHEYGAASLQSAFVYELSTGASKLFEFPKIVSRLPSAGGTSVLVRMHHHLMQHQHLMQRHFPGEQLVSNLSSHGCIKVLVRVVRVTRASCQLTTVHVVA